ALEIETVIHRTTLWLLSLLLLILPMGLIFGLLKNNIFHLNFTGLALLISLMLMLFLAYYNRLKPRIDHFFNRKRYSYQMVLAEMPSRIGSSLDLQVLSVNLFRELKEVLYVRNALILVKQPNQSELEVYSAAGYETAGRAVKLTYEKKSHPERTDFIQWMAVNGRSLEREQVEIDPQFSRIRENAIGFFRDNSLELLIPIMLQDRMIGILGLGKKENLQAYRIKDIELLEVLGRQIGITMDNSLHHGDIVEKERIAEELRLGREIQLSLLPHNPPQLAHLVIQGLMQPAKEIGGDYYDFIPQQDRNDCGIVIGDVSGKGLAAGLMMAMVKTAIYIFSHTESSPKKNLIHINEILDKHLGGEKFMTMLYLVWQAASSTLTYSSAGHEHILLYRKASDKVEAIPSGGLILGVKPDIEDFLEERRIHMETGDKILLYTDGVTEALNPGKDRYGLNRLTETFLRHAARPASKLLASVKEEVYSFMGTHPQADDITLVVMEAV
ncbi:MAG: SpoIIE family protein phosphatase, partial [bacterium]|nr:SpoIIE family protein phosphatase [bacterium]